ncbi:toxin-antitoxin system HicB family antitoxin [candidate division KSB1 bacterium]|nr:toxin-antitoxin system HicB family antitoxin [candidate division KSB1 bacterium]MCH7753905.1 toxin-antitoxin system HicB family antitoxin [candidate division KSB1 bacterium]MCH8019995.1 toxin-antitoxin system HicB family antitoxin [candidate division KSB1 bacterium]
MAKLQLRLPESIHNKVRRIAKKEKLSINQLLVNSISSEIIRYETMKFFEDRSKNFNENDFLDALKQIPEIEPEEQDKFNIER